MANLCESIIAKDIAFSCDELATKGLELNRLTILGGIISMVFLYLFAYTGINMEPLFCTHLSIWPLCHWVCYIYIAYFFLAFLKYTYTRLRCYSSITTYIEKIGKFSYEIYLFQIFYFTTLSIFVGNTLSYIDYYPIQRILFIIISTVICVIPVVYCKSKKQESQ